EGDAAIFWQRVDGSGAAERLTKPEPGASHIPESWSPDGKVLLFNETKGSAVSLWSLSLSDKTLAPFDSVHSYDAPTTAAFSPNGRWVAYGSSRNGVRTGALFVQPFPPTGATYQIGTGGGVHPLWSPDGRELFFNPSQTDFAVVSISTQPTFTFGN